MGASTVRITAQPITTAQPVVFQREQRDQTTVHGPDGVDGQQAEVVHESVSDGCSEVSRGTMPAAPSTVPAGRIAAVSLRRSSSR
jgi:hypothetical protein